MTQGHIDAEDFRGDPAFNELGQKGIRARPTKPKAPKKPKKPRKSKKAKEEAEDDEEVEEPVGLPSCAPCEQC